MARSFLFLYHWGDYSFMLAFIRFSSIYGYPKYLLPNKGSQLVKGCELMQLKFTDIQHRLNCEFGIQFETCPVGGHNMPGKVEIQVKEPMKRKLLSHRLTILEWETLGDQIANSVNNMPLVTITISADIENSDINTR